MSYYKNTTQTPNELFDILLKTLTKSELKVLLIIIRRTIGMIHPDNPSKRLDRAWISQRLFMKCCSLSGRAVSQAIDTLVQKKLIEVTNEQERILISRQARRGSPRLYFASRLRLEPTPKQASEPASTNPVTKGHTIKLNNIKLSCYNRSQGVEKISDRERYLQIQNKHNILQSKDTPK